MTFRQLLRRRTAPKPPEDPIQNPQIVDVRDPTGLLGSKGDKNRPPSSVTSWRRPDSQTSGSNLLSQATSKNTRHL